jgi:hypothetical protein
MLCLRAVSGLATALRKLATRTILQKVGQRFQTVSSDTCFRFICGDERNYVVGEDFSVGFRAIYRCQLCNQSVVKS